MSTEAGMPLRVLTWHVHGSYLWYLSHVPHTFYLPVKPGRPEGHGGRSGSFRWPDNMVDVPAGEVRDLDLDVVLTQSLRNWETDRHELLSPEQLALPRVHLEHDPPRQSPTDTLHPVQDEAALLVHVTPFNALMWDSGVTPARVVDHGVVVDPSVEWTGERERGVTVVNGLGRRGRRLGADVFAAVAERVPLDLAGMFADEVGRQGRTGAGGGHVLGDVPLGELHRRLGTYRFFFNPIRYTSLGLAVCEAMTAGLPVLGLATTEMATAVENGISGYVDTDPEVLVRHMRRLLSDPSEAAALSTGARKRAQERFGIERFARDWDEVLSGAAGRPVPAPRVGAGAAAGAAAAPSTVTTSG